MRSIARTWKSRASADARTSVRTSARIRAAARMTQARAPLAIMLALALIACSNAPGDCKARTGDGICVDDIANEAARG